MSPTFEAVAELASRACMGSACPKWTSVHQATATLSRPATCRISEEPVQWYTHTAMASIRGSIKGVRRALWELSILHSGSKAPRTQTFQHRNALAKQVMLHWATIRSLFVVIWQVAFISKQAPIYLCTSRWRSGRGGDGSGRGRSRSRGRRLQSVHTCRQTFQIYICQRSTLEQLLSGQLGGCHCIGIPLRLLRMRG